MDKKFKDLDQFEQLRVYMDYQITQNADKLDFDFSDGKEYNDIRVYEVMCINGSTSVKRISYNIILCFRKKHHKIMNFDEFKNASDGFVAEHWYKNIYLNS